MSEKNRTKNFLKILIKLIVKVKRDDIFSLASQLSYYIVLSFFPLMIFLMSLIGFINVDSTEVIEGIKSVVPISLFSLTESIVMEVLNSQSVSLVGGSIFVAIWMSSSGFRAVIKGINKAYDMKETRTFIKRTIIAYISTIIFAIAIIISLSILVFGGVLGDYIIRILPLGGAMEYIWNMVRFGIIIFFLIIIFASLYKFTPCKKFKWREVFPGAIVSAVGWVIASLIFSFYINNFNNYSKFYGSLAAVFILMLWIFITSMIIILGVEVNSVIVDNKE